MNKVSLIYISTYTQTFYNYLKQAMKRLYKNLPALILSLALLSCNKEEGITPSTTFKSELSVNAKNSTIEKIKYFYRGKWSTVKYEVFGDSAVLLDGKDNERIRKAFQVPTLATYVDAKDTNMIYLYDTFAELDNKVLGKLDKVAPNNVIGVKTTTATNTDEVVTALATPPELPVVEFWEHKDYSGETIKYSFINDPWGYRIAYLRNFGWSDRITSMGVYNMCTSSSTDCYNYTTTVILYEHDNFGGKSWTIGVASNQALSWSNFKDYKMGGLFSSNWNDEVSSIWIYWTKNLL